VGVGGRFKKEGKIFSYPLMAQIKPIEEKIKLRPEWA